MGSKAVRLKNIDGDKIYPAPWYPVGSIYISVNETNPTNYFGGTWERIQDTFLLCAGSTYSAGSTGGEATHTLTVDEMPSHSHSNPCAVVYNGNATYYRSLFATNSDFWSKSDWNNATASTGGGQAHNNMPPYLAVYVWKRTA